MKKISRREALVTFLTVALALSISIFGVRWYMHRGKSRPAQNNSSSSQGSKQQTAGQPTSIRLIATGDFMPHDTVNQAAKQPDGNYDYMPIMQNMKLFFDRSDIRFCNQAVPGGGASFGITGYPVFNSPTDFLRDMDKLGCNLINNASNHSFDKGQADIDATLDYWATQPNILAMAGENHNAQEQNKVHYFEVKGVKFAFLAYTTYTNSKPPNGYGVNVYSNDLAQRQLSEARAKADIIIVSMRWGTEYSPDITAGQNQIAQTLADEGADVIIGHGPHVLQPVKMLKGQGDRAVPVWFSIGNFINSQIQTEALFNGLAVMDIDITTKAITLKYLPIYMHYEWSADEAKSQDLLKRHNLMMYTLDQTTDALISANQLKTTVAAERQRINDTLNKFTKVVVLHDSEY